MARRDPRGRAAFAKARFVERGYGIQLRRLAKHVADILNATPLADFAAIDPLVRALERYAQVVDPWANAAASSMILAVAHRDTQAWEQHTEDMGHALVRELREAPTGVILQQLQQDQVTLIKSLPLQAAERVHELAQQGLSEGQRFDSIVDAIQALGGITRNRATLIARTEVGRVASNLTQARATFIGSEGYIWRSSEDGDVRPSHRKVAGKYFRWDSPPKTDANLAPYHPGCGPNCRCYAEPVIPQRFE